MHTQHTDPTACCSGHLLLGLRERRPEARPSSANPGEHRAPPQPGSGLQSGESLGTLSQNARQWGHCTGSTAPLLAQELCPRDVVVSRARETEMTGSMCPKAKGPWVPSVPGGVRYQVGAGAHLQEPQDGRREAAKVRVIHPCRGQWRTSHPRALR